MTTVSAVNDTKGKKISAQENCRIFLPANLLARRNSRFGSQPEA